MKAIDFDDAYINLLDEALSSPEEKNERTGSVVKVIEGGTSFLLDLKDGLLPTIGIRKTFPKSAAAEIAWYCQGSRDVTWLKKYAPFWDKFVEADGKTIASAYGYRWRSHFHRDQLMDAVIALANDPSNRRINISAWDPGEDGLGRTDQKNVPCPTNFTLSIQGGYLHSSLFLRSSDLFVGLPYDVMGHVMLMRILATTIDPNLELGKLHVTLAHAHLYESHWYMASQSLVQDVILPRIEVPTWTLFQVISQPDAYVKSWEVESAKRVWPRYNPKPEVIE